MEVKLRTQDDCDIVDLVGEFDFLTAQDVKDQIIDVIQSGIQKLVINLEQLKYIDSTGLGILITLWTKAREKNVAFKYAGLNGSVEKVITLSRMHLFLPICKTVEEAVKALQ